MKYQTIVVDPPWHYPEGFAATTATGRDRRAGGVRVVRQALPYASMTLEQIRQLPLADLAAPHCRLFLWTTNRFLPTAFGVLESWGCAYRQTLIWHKPDAFFGGSLAPNAEFLLVGVWGTPKRLGRIPSAVITYAQRQLRHSQKPECFLDYIEACSPGPYLELFARRNRLGWDTWGNEALNHVDL